MQQETWHLCSHWTLPSSTDWGLRGPKQTRTIQVQKGTQLQRRSWPRKGERTEGQFCITVEHAYYFHSSLLTLSTGVKLLIGSKVQCMICLKFPIKRGEAEREEKGQECKFIKKHTKKYQYIHSAL